MAASYLPVGLVEMEEGWSEQSESYRLGKPRDANKMEVVETDGEAWKDQQDGSSSLRMECKIEVTDEGGKGWR